MATITKKELIDLIAVTTKQKRVNVKRIVQSFLDNIIVELGKGNRLEFRDFGVFEVKQRQPRMAQNPKTLEPVKVPPKRTVKFKVGRIMKEALGTSKTAGGASGRAAVPASTQTSAATAPAASSDSAKV